MSRLEALRSVRGILEGEGLFRIALIVKGVDYEAEDSCARIEWDERFEEAGRVILRSERQKHRDESDIATSRRRRH